MRIHEIITEAPISNDPQREPWGLVPYNQSENNSKTIVQKIPENLNGGEIITQYILNKDGEVESYSYSYNNSKICKSELVLSYEIDKNDNIIAYHYIKYPEGMKFWRLTDMSIRNEFASEVGSYINRDLKENTQEIDSKNPLQDFMEISNFIIASRQRRRERMLNNINIKTDEN